MIINKEEDDKGERSERNKRVTKRVTRCKREARLHSSRAIDTKADDRDIEN